MDTGDAKNFEYKPAPVDTVLTDAALFAAVNLDYNGLSAVKAAVNANNISKAKTEMAKYLRTRRGLTWWFDPHVKDASRGNSSCLQLGYDISNHTGGYDSTKFLANGDLDWINNPSFNSLTRMYFLESLGAGYWYSGTEYPTGTMWSMLLRSWIRQCPKTASPNGDYWSTLVTGIPARSGWPMAFNYFLDSPTFTDENMILYLKSTIEQARHLRINHSSQGNWLTFEMAGLYAVGVLFPELKESS